MFARGAFRFRDEAASYMDVFMRAPHAHTRHRGQRHESATACESSDVDVRSVTGEPSSHLLSLGTATCNADLSAEVEETAEEVRIRVHAENDTRNDCRDFIRVTLDDALGDRSVIDERTGEELRVMPPD